MEITLRDGDWFDIDHGGEYDSDGNEMLAARLFGWRCGQFIHYEIVRLAIHHGFQLDPNSETVIRVARNQTATAKVAATDDVIELATQAQTYLNNNIAPEGWRFDWHEDEFWFANEYWFRYE